MLYCIRHHFIRMQSLNINGKSKSSTKNPFGYYNLCKCLAITTITLRMRGEKYNKLLQSFFS